jgi:hypothetical protein
MNLKNSEHSKFLYLIKFSYEKFNKMIDQKLKII